MYGTTRLGPRGQVVIPAEARRDLNLKPGDVMVVMAKFGRVLGIMKVDEIEHLIAPLMEHITDQKVRRQVEENAAKMLGIKSLKK
jgi:AbrB family looped-hinge helix DNA binding protein